MVTMSTNDLFGADEAMLEESDDSFIADSEPVSDSDTGSAKPTNDEDNSYYEFLFGSDPDRTEDGKKQKKTKKSASAWQKEYDRRAREVDAQNATFDNVEAEINFGLEHLSDHFERRQGVESEMLSLFSGLLTREQFTVDQLPTPSSARAGKVDVPDVDRAMNKMMKKLIRQTFHGRAPEGRFGGFSKPAEETSKNVTTAKVSTVITIGKDAFSNLQDLNILLSRERDGDYVELDGVPLYKHTRYGTLYIFENNFITSFILPLCSKLLREPHGAEQDVQAYTQEIVYLLYQLSQPPSEAWYNYWTEAQTHYRALAKSKEYEHEPMVAMELKRRARIVWHYLNGLVSFRSSLQSADLWALIGEFRLNLENFQLANCQTLEQKQRAEYLQKLQDDLANERDNLIAQEQANDDEDDEHKEHSRLKKDQSAAESRKKRIQEIRQQLFSVNEELARNREDHMTAQQQTSVHIKTIRLLVMHVLTVPGDGLSTLCLLQESGLLPLLKKEVISCFESCKRGFTVSETGEISAHAAYLNERQRETVWEYVRLVHSLMVCLDIGGLLSIVYYRVKPEEMQLNEEVMRSAEELQNRQMDDEYFLGLTRINPKLARLTIRGHTKLGKFLINERQGAARSYSNYDQWFRFPTLSHLQTPFEVSSGLSSRNYHSSFSVELFKSLQSEMHSLIGIDEDFEHCHWTDKADGDKLYYEFGLMLSLCLVDLSREAQDRYYQSSDYQVVLDLHSMVTTYYRCLYIYIRCMFRQENRQPPPETYVLLALRRYVGNDSLCARVSCAYLWHLIRKQSMSKTAHIGAVSALRALYSDLCLMSMFGNLDSNLAMFRICQDTLTAYFKGDVRAIIFWILRYFKPLSHSANLFAFALSNLHLMRKVLAAIGSVSFTQETIRSEKLGYDYDSDSSDDGNSAVKTILVTADGVFTSRNRNTASDDIIYNGRVVYNCVCMLANFRTNTVHMNDLLVSHLELVPLPMFYDVKYFYVFRDIMSDKRIWQNARWRWVGDFCAQVLESFFDSWLGRRNRFLPVELFFNKCAPSTKGPFRPCARENIIPISRGYERCDLLNELLRRPDSTVYDVSKEMRGGDPNGAWDPDEDAALLQYHNKFMFLDDPISYIAELLGRRTADVLKRLHELNVIDEVNPSTGASSTSYMQELIQKLVKKFTHEAITVCAELHDNIMESLEMQKLGGADAVCEVMEPMSASARILESFEFKELLKCLGISQKWLLPKDTSSMGPLMDILGDPSNYVELGDKEAANASHAARRQPEKKVYVPPVVTSRDIAKLILGLLQCLERNNVTLQLSDLLIKATSLVESASVIGRATAVYEGLPEDQEAVSQISALLQIAKIHVQPPILVCSGVTDLTAAMDRLKVAQNLSKLSQERLESIVNAEAAPMTRVKQRTVSTTSNMETEIDQFEQHLDLDGEVPFHISKKGMDKPSGKKQKDGKPKGPGEPKTRKKKASVKDPSIKPALDELQARLKNGEARINTADLMGVAHFDNWDQSFENLREKCKSLGAIEESVDGTLWVIWPKDGVTEALSELTRGKPQAMSIDIGVRCRSGTQEMDLSAFERLEIDRDLVASLYSESLRLAKEGKLENAVKSRDDLKRLLEH